VRAISGILLTAVLGTAVWVYAGAPYDPHGDPATGVLLKTTFPPTRGACTQCHPEHADDGFGSETVLFTENDNRLAFFDQGEGPCHRDLPDNYPLTELDRIPEGQPNAGYFEANSGGIRRKGVRERGRWPGEAVFTSFDTTPSGRFISPHAQDPDMPRRGDTGEGLCLNCHTPHASENPFDLLTGVYLGIGGHESLGPPDRYQACLGCHGPAGPAGMDLENHRISDYYDAGLNGDAAGHQIRRNPAVALSWPSHIQNGDMLPCYDCHNPHGSRGYNGVEPNGWLISDERPGWSGLTDTVGDPSQCRRFCFGCHIPSDGIAGTQEVEGIVMNVLSGAAGHAAADAESCYRCHGSDYDAPLAHNAHNPDPDPGF